MIAHLSGGSLPPHVWLPSRVAEILDRAAGTANGVMFHGGRFVSYAELRDDARNLAATLDGRSRIVRSDDPRVFLTTLWACFAAGIVPILAAPRFSDAGEIASSEDTALVMVTSGSTGTPKIVRLTHGNVVASIAASTFVNGYDASDISLNWLPLHHIGALMRAIRDTYIGCNQVQVPTDAVSGDRVQWLELLDRHRATLAWAPNSAFASIVRAESLPAQLDLSSVRSLYSSGEPVVLRTMQKFAERLAPHGLARTALHAAWGMTEACFATWSHEAADVADAGKPVPGVELRVVDDELQIRGPLVAADGWLPTGDTAIIRDGAVTITGRRKDMIKVGGIAFGSREIETAAEEITTAAAISVEADGAETLALFIDDASLVHNVRASVARACGVAPRFVIPVAAFPIGETGKLDRAALRRRFDERAWHEWPFDLRVQPNAISATQEEKLLAMRIAAVMAAALDVPLIELDANFFASGGTSLRVAQTAVRLQCEPADLFHAPTPLALAARLSRRETASAVAAGTDAAARRIAARRERGAR